MARFVLFVTSMLPLAAAEGILHNLLSIRPCSRSSRDLNSCVKTLLEDARPFLANGSPDLDIPSLEPFRVPEVLLSFQEGYLDILCRNVEVRHLTDYNIDAVRVNETEKMLSLVLRLPHIELTMDFKVLSEVFSQNFNATGSLEAHARDCQIALSLTGELYQRDGVDYIRVRDAAVDVSIGSLSAVVSNMDNKFLSIIINSYLKQSKEKLAEIVGPTVGRVLADKLPTFANTLLALLPYKLFIQE